MKTRAWLGAAVALALFLAGSAFAAGQPQEKGVRPALRKEIVKLKYMDANDAQMLLLSYRSREGSINLLRDAVGGSLIVISDTPETVDKMLALIREVDVKPAELVFTVQLILGSESAKEKTDEALVNDPIVKEIRALLKYKSFTLLDSNLIRTIERTPGQVTMGRQGQYLLSLKPKYIRDGKEESIQADIEFGYYFSGQQKTNLIQSTLAMRPGEKTVVGVSKPQGTENVDRGLILIITGKVLK